MSLGYKRKWVLSTLEGEDLILYRGGRIHKSIEATTYPWIKGSSAIPLLKTLNSHEWYSFVSGAALCGNSVKPGYNDIALCRTSPITSDILRYHLIPHANHNIIFLCYNNTRLLRVEIFRPFHNVITDFGCGLVLVSYVLALWSVMFSLCRAYCLVRPCTELTGESWLTFREP